MVGNNVPHYSEALEVAGSRPVSFLPDSSSAFDKHRWREEGIRSLVSLLLLGYPWTVISWLLCRQFFPQHPVRSAKSTTPAPWTPKKPVKGISTTCYTYSVRKDSDVPMVRLCGRFIFNMFVCVRERVNRYFYDVYEWSVYSRMMQCYIVTIKRETLLQICILTISFFLWYLPATV